MKEKYLPIGTVCNIKGNSNKIMIVGYLPIDYNGNINLYDYKGCIYPNGVFSNNLISFNHNEIENVEFMGYETAEQKTLNSNLNNASIVETAKERTKSSKPKYLFDKNGVIIMDNTVTTPTSNTPAPQVDNPFAMEYESKEVKSNNQFKFDENGVIIEDNTVKSEAPKAPSSRYEFDENGFIVKDNTVSEVKTEVAQPKIIETPKYKFDENGVIIA